METIQLFVLAPAVVLLRLFSLSHLEASSHDKIDSDLQSIHRFVRTCYHGTKNQVSWVHTLVPTYLSLDVTQAWHLVVFSGYSTVCVLGCVNVWVYACS